jgi:hypothetical protein
MNNSTRAHAWNCLHRAHVGWRGSIAQAIFRDGGGDRRTKRREQRGPAKRRNIFGTSRRSGFAERGSKSAKIAASGPLLGQAANAGRRARTWANFGGFVLTSVLTRLFFSPLVASFTFENRRGRESNRDYLPPVTVYPSALRSSANSISIWAAASNGMGFRCS